MKTKKIRDGLKLFCCVKRDRLGMPLDIIYHRASTKRAVIRQLGQRLWWWKDEDLGWDINLLTHGRGKL